MAGLETRSNPFYDPGVERPLELAALDAALRRSRLISVVGPPGSGKSRLAHSWALGHGADFVDIGTPPRLPDLSTASRSTVVIDDWPVDDARLTQDLESVLSRSPHVSVVLTARRPTGARGESVLSVGGLETPAATTLLIERVNAAGGLIDEDLAGAIAALVDGLPAPLEAAAWRVARLGAAVVRDELRECPWWPPLTGGRWPVAAQRVDAMYRQVIDDLAPELRALAGVLAAFDAPFTVDDALALVGAASEGVTAGLARLCDEAVLAPFARGRLFMWAPFRGILRQALTDEERTRGSLRHAYHFLARLEELDVAQLATASDEWLDGYRVAEADFDRAMATLLAHDPDAADRMAFASFHPLRQLHRWDEATVRLGRVLARSPEGATVTVRTRLRLAALYAARRLVSEAAREFELAHRGARALGDRRLESEALAGLAAMSTLAGDDAGGLDLYERALTAARAAGSRADLILNNMAMNEWRLGRLNEARTHAEAALAELPESSYRWIVATDTLARIERSEGRRLAAASRYAALGRIGLERDHHHAVAIALLALAELLESTRPALSQMMLRASDNVVARHNLVLSAEDTASANRLRARQRRRSGPESNRRTTRPRSVEALLREAEAAFGEEPGVDATALSPRQRQVAALIVDGLTNREIAAELGVSERTVDTHVELIKERAGVQRRPELVAWGLWAGVQEAAGPKS